MNSPIYQSPSQPASKAGGTKETPDHTPILVDAKQAAAMLAISPRTLFTYTRCGAIDSVRIGRAVRYRVADIEAWAEAGCPARKEAGR